VGYKIRDFDPAERAREKQASRDEDARRLNAGEFTREELAKKNDFFAGFVVEKFKIKSVGGEPFDLRGKKKRPTK
jgi:hypothetical protein